MTPKRKKQSTSRVIPIEVDPQHIVAKYYQGTDRAIPVKEYIDALQDVDVRQKILSKIEMIHELCTTDNPHLPMPHSRPIEGAIHELRVQHGKDRYRILYALSDRMCVLLHIFRKGGDLTPEQDKVLARRRWDDFKKRMNATPRTPPSPLSTGFAP